MKRGYSLTNWTAIFRTPNVRLCVLLLAPVVGLALFELANGQWMSALYQGAAVRADDDKTELSLSAKSNDWSTPHRDRTILESYSLRLSYSALYGLSVTSLYVLSLAALSLAVWVLYTNTRTASRWVLYVVCGAVGLIILPYYGWKLLINKPGTLPVTDAIVTAASHVLQTNLQLAVWPPKILIFAATLLYGSAVVSCAVSFGKTNEVASSELRRRIAQLNGLIIVFSLLLAVSVFHLQVALVLPCAWVRPEEVEHLRRIAISLSTVSGTKATCTLLVTFIPARMIIKSRIWELSRQASAETSMTPTKWQESVGLQADRFFALSTLLSAAVPLVTGAFWLQISNAIGLN
jgi:hypothetical protein